MEELKLDPLLQKELSATGFPSPADDYMEVPLDLNKHLIKNPTATFFVRARGNSMEEFNVYNGDLLVVDRSRLPGSGSTIIADVSGELSLRQLRNTRDGLCIASPSTKPQLINEVDFETWGVVSHIIHNT